ncbi:ABC transporter ATP-binding protein [Aquirufa aurantiipilula]|uniref:ABC transporter ATP-binding protein n=1 Tax=Aquirufa aurantiipilula TaxID=2696561 RepID=A0ABT6BHU4_9BACT|nr:ABC transporter ATP-binding protein [Aquirufa aurantiipilula]MDF5689474.1 ABC transporter ATP-binding protein [Aquirufa aurantiipilula]
MPESIISIQHLSKSFGTFQAVKDVSFQVFKGDVFGFLGPNGAGKSTSMRCMLSLIKADSGDIRLFDLPIKNHREEILRRTGSIVEKPDFYKYLSAYRNLDIFARISGTYSSKKEIYAMLDFVGLNGREHDKVGGFSHGMKQRLGIAQTLLHNPDLIVLDEPTTGLDPQGIIDIRNLILRLKDEHQKTILLSSHDLSEIEMIANRMVIINKGKSIVEGSVKELMSTENLFIRLEVEPQQKALRLLKNAFPDIPIQVKGENQLEFHLNRNQVPSISQLLNSHEIAIYSLESKRSLEDYFIKIVQQDAI